MFVQIKQVEDHRVPIDGHGACQVRNNSQKAKPRVTMAIISDRTGLAG